MKQISFLLAIICFVATSTFVNAQDCTGTPAANTIVPQSPTICVGSVASLSLATTYTGTGYTYQWAASPISQVGPFIPVPGATLSAYTTPTLPSSPSPIYLNVTITCTASGQSITINNILYVVPCNPQCSGTPGASTIMPATQTLCAGDVATMSLSTTYTDQGITYQWGSSTLSTGFYAPVPGATLSTYTTSPLTTTMYYNVVVTCSNSGLSYFAPTHTVSVVQCTYCSGTPAANAIVPVSPTICTGGSVSLSLANSYSASGITYQWQSSAVSMGGPFAPIPGATLSTYNTPTLASTMYYNVVITCTNSGQTYNTSQMITVVSCTSPCNGTPAGSSILPLSHSICAGDAATMSLSTNYTNTGIGFQWGSSATAGGPFAAVPGATLSTYTSGNLLSTMYYNVTVTCANSGQTFIATHTVAVVSCTYCNSTPGSNTILPLSYSVCSGSSASLSLAISYTYSGITYQWQSSSVSISGPFNPVSGATSGIYVSSSLTSTMYYNVIITCTNSGASINTSNMVSVISCTGLRDLDPLYETVVYPNPGTGEFTITSKGSAIGTLIITDILGKIILTKQTAARELKVDLTAQPKGIYYGRIQNDKTTRVVRIMKE